MGPSMSTFNTKQLLELFFFSLEISYHRHCLCMSQSRKKQKPKTNTILQDDLKVGTLELKHISPVLSALCFTPCRISRLYLIIMFSFICLILYLQDIKIFGDGDFTVTSPRRCMMLTKDNRFTVVLPPANRGAGCCISHLPCLQSGKVWHLRIVFEETDFVGLHWRRWQDYQSQRPWLGQTWASIVPWFSNLNIPRAGDTGLFPLSPSYGCNICLYGWPTSGWLLSLLLVLPLSHYDVPQQGLLGELILIQQQIQQHEEEVRRAAAANNARPPPPEPAPSPPPNPSPPQHTRKVKVPTHLDPAFWEIIVS